MEKVSGNSTEAELIEVLEADSIEVAIEAVDYTASQ